MIYFGPELPDKRIMRRQRATSSTRRAGRQQREHEHGADDQRAVALDGRAEALIHWLQGMPLDVGALAQVHERGAPLARRVALPREAIRET